MRVVLDPNVLVSAAISPNGPPRQILTAWVDERFELIASPNCWTSSSTCSPDRSSRATSPSVVASEFVAGLTTDAVIVPYAPPLPGISPDPDDDYLVALARSASADYLVSGDPHLLGLTDPDPTVLSPRQFVDLLTAGF